jgi:predicted RNase H-like HicB family nuclease
MLSVKDLIVLYAVVIKVGRRDAAFSASIPDLPGCAAMGDTLEKAITNAREVAEEHIEALIDEGKPVPVATRNPDELFKRPEYLGCIWATVQVDVIP